MTSEVSALSIKGYEEAWRLQLGHQWCAEPAFQQEIQPRRVAAAEHQARSATPYPTPTWECPGTERSCRFWLEEGRQLMFRRVVVDKCASKGGSNQLFRDGKDRHQAAIINGGPFFFFGTFFLCFWYFFFFRGPLGPWSPGPLVPWSAGLPVCWSPGSLVCYPPFFEAVQVFSKQMNDETMKTHQTTFFKAYERLKAIMRALCSPPPPPAPCFKVCERLKLVSANGGDCAPPTNPPASLSRASLFKARER